MSKNNIKVLAKVSQEWQAWMRERKLLKPIKKKKPQIFEK